MRKLLFLILSCSHVIPTFAQEGVRYYQNIAGDTAISLPFGNDYVLFQKHLQDTLKGQVMSGTY